jgi:hypothetical protein
MFRFTIRELVLVTVIVARGVAWRLERQEVGKMKQQSLPLSVRETASLQDEGAWGKLPKWRRAGVEPDQAGPTPAAAEMTSS